MPFQIDGRHGRCTWQFTSYTSRLTYYAERPSTAILVSLLAIGVFTWGNFQYETMMWAGVGLMSAELVSFIIIKASKEKKKEASFRCVTQSLGSNQELMQDHPSGFEANYTFKRYSRLKECQDQYSASSDLMFFPHYCELSPKLFLKVAFPKYNFIENPSDKNQDSTVGWDREKFTELGNGHVISFFDDIQRCTNFVLLKDKSSGQTLIAASVYLLDKDDRVQGVTAQCQYEDIDTVLKDIAHRFDADTIIMGIDTNAAYSRCSLFTSQSGFSSSSQATYGTTTRDYVTVWSRRPIAIGEKEIPRGVPLCHRLTDRFSNHSPSFVEVIVQ